MTIRSWLGGLAALCLTAAPMGAALSKQIVDYRITARLDPESKTVHGSQVLSWRNDSKDTVSELQFHLYMNAFKNQKTTFMRESGGSSHSHPLEKDAWGWIDLTRIAIDGGADLTKSVRFIQPDDGNLDDQTVISVALPSPVKPGAGIRLAMDFETKLPQVSARTGYRQNFFLVAQWFPKIGVWEQAGERYATTSGWNCHQFHANSEFYADYGRYDVSITVPARFVVGATGVMTEKRDGAGTRTTSYRFVQEDVHDFAWTASTTYIRVERRFEADREADAATVAATASLLGLRQEDVRLKDVRMILLIQPEHSAQIERHFRATADGLKYYGLWYGAYPYETITVVDPPFGAGAAGGMEYPTFITAGTSWRVRDDEPGPEDVTIHEFGHQYWYAMVGNNEFEEAWLDEGINTYSTAKVVSMAYPSLRVPLPLLGFSFARWIGTPRLDWKAVDRAGHIAMPRADIVVRRAWEFTGARSYAINSYFRPANNLQTLENYLGEQTMARVMRTYFQRWKFRHPATRDFIQVVHEVSGRDMQWFFDRFFFGSNVVDYAVSAVDCTKDATRLGVYDGPKGRVTIDGKQARKTDEQNRKSKRPDSYDCEVTLERNGEAVFPVELTVKFSDGKTERRQWDGEYRWTRFKFTSASEIESAQIDPGYKITLDVNYSNNSWSKSVQGKAVAKWTENLLFWMQNLLMGLNALT